MLLVWLHPERIKLQFMGCRTLLWIAARSIQQLFCGWHAAKAQLSAGQSGGCQFCHNGLLVLPAYPPPPSHTKTSGPQQFGVRGWAWVINRGTNCYTSPNLRGSLYLGELIVWQTCCDLWVLLAARGNGGKGVQVVTDGFVCVRVCGSVQKVSFEL